MSENTKHPCSAANASLFYTWLTKRGGIAIWKSINLGNAGASWSSPATIRKGDTQDCPAGEEDQIVPYPKPNWQCENTPSRIITDINEVVVEIPKEVKRFYVAVRRSGNGLSLKVTDGGTRRIRAACEKAGAGAGSWYEFDYSSQEAVIYVPSETIPLKEWIEKHGVKS